MIAECSPAVVGLMLTVKLTATLSGKLIDAGELHTRVGDVLPLADARIAHEMLAGKPHKLGKIVLTLDGGR